MSLLAQMNQPNGTLVNGKPQYYFALDSTPDDPTVTAPAFVATGVAGGPSGTFTAYADAVPAGTGVLNINKALPNGNVGQWSLGLTGVPAGANSGNDLTLFSYTDTGAFLNTSLIVDRSSNAITTFGDMNIGEDLLVGQTIASNVSVTAPAINATTVAAAPQVVAGNPGTLGGGLLQVSGTAGVARAYDPIYNRPGPGAEVINTTWGPTGAILTNPTYTPAKTGLYTITMEVTTDANGYAWTNGSSIILGYFQSPFPPFPLLSDSYMVCDSLANPTGLNTPVTGGGVLNNVCKKDITVIVNLTAGIQYAAQINVIGGFNLGATGGVAFYIQPLLA